MLFKRLKECVLISFILDTIRFWKVRRFKRTILKWQDETFTSRTVYSIIHHLGRECGELCEALQSGNRQDIKNEAADVTLLFWGFEHELSKMACIDNYKCAKDKFYGDLVNREWSKPDEHGVMEHVKSIKSD